MFAPPQVSDLHSNGGPGPSHQYESSTTTRSCAAVPVALREFPSFFFAALTMALPGVSGNMNTAYMGRVAANIQTILGHPELADLATARPLTSGKAGSCVEKSVSRCSVVNALLL